MKMKKRFWAVYLIIAFSFLACSASKDLSRGKAEEILKKQDFGFETGTIPSTITRYYIIGAPEGYPESKQSYKDEVKQNIDNFIKKNKDYLERLKGLGLITYNMEVVDKKNLKDSKQITFKIQPTSKLSPYILSNDGSNYIVKIFTWIFDKVTGITKISENEAKVEFTVFAKHEGDVSTYAKYDGDVHLNTNRSAIFQRYDDGWRLMETAKEAPMQESD
jgi:hypothetical protein